MAGDPTSQANAKKLTFGSTPILVDYAEKDGEGNNIANYYLPTSSFTWSNLSGRPTTLSQFTNDSGYITTSALSGYATQTWVQQNPKYTITVSGSTLTIRENY